MNSLIKKALLPAGLFAVVTIGGCTAYDDAGPPYGVIVDRGYYFDPDYYDGYGHYHPREYWYYDGHSYVHRDGMPHGEIAHLRMRSDHAGGAGHDSVHADNSAHGGGFGDHGGDDHGGDDHGGGGDHGR